VNGVAGTLINREPFQCIDPSRASGVFRPQTVAKA
jgi:hypothetical protein